jgi:hypothetical protein
MEFDAPLHRGGEEQTDPKLGASREEACTPGSLPPLVEDKLRATGEGYVSTVIEEILAERSCGRVHCGTTDADSLEGAAAALGLTAEEGIYREIARDVAQDLVVELLHRDLAYGLQIMPLDRALDLADRFLVEVTRDSCRFFTNMTAPMEPAPTSSRVRVGPSWNPATTATFDMGVLVVAPSGGACFWVEDED